MFRAVFPAASIFPRGEVTASRAFIIRRMLMRGFVRFLGLVKRPAGIPRLRPTPRGNEAMAMNSGGFFPASFGDGAAQLPVKHTPATLGKLFGCQLV